MNVLFLTTGRMGHIQDHTIYPDLLRQFRDNGHNVYHVSTYEKRVGKETEYVEECGTHALRVKIGNLTKVNIIEKGISTLMIEKQYLAAVKKYLSKVKFDLILYSTPPVTLVNVIPMKSLNATNNARRIALLTHTAAEILITSCIVVCLIIPLYVPKI